MKVLHVQDDERIWPLLRQDKLMNVLHILDPRDEEQRIQRTHRFCVMHLLINHHLV
ncbi:MAG TPA: hypothetical protein VLH83_09690 [Chthoniobacterales bacterium]|nr:hypothetical protein [Chthoniobacterales bacterium]